MFKPCTTKTSIINRSFDEMGNLLWQQEAAEFVEQYPQRRRPQTAALLLKQSSSAGTLYRKPETIIPTLNKRASGGELLTAQQRHQRDLFSGDLGIPEVNSHVGSMVHTFENMALQRQMAEKQREQRERENSKYFAELLAMQAAAQAVAVAQVTSAAAATSQQRSFISTASGNSNNKFQKLKKKTHETRQKIIQQILQNHPLHKEVTKNQGTPRHIRAGTMQASSNSEVYYRNIEDDYRKNLFSTLSSRKVAPENPPLNPPQHSELETSSFCDEIVAQAFDEIFEGYSGLEDDEDMEDIKTDVLIPDFSNTTNFIQQYGRPGLTPKKLPPITVHKKAPPPPPPSFSTQSQGQRKIMPISENKQKSSTFHNLLGRLKTPPLKSPLSYNLNKNSSDSLLKTDQLLFTPNKLLHKFPPLEHLNREVEGQESSEKLDQDFLRGSTVSQSFVGHLKVHKPSKGKAPPVPQETSQSAKRPLKTSEALRQILLFSKRSKSAGELLPDDYTTVETHKYYRRLGDNERQPQQRLQHQQQQTSRERIIDGCSGGLGNTTTRPHEVAEL